jgi:hypothetical protein
MMYVVICAVALAVAAMTLLSGFGLGTLLMPAFALFFPIDVAIAATAVVHLADNVFNAALVGRKADFRTVIIFVPPAAIFAVGGALILNYVSGAKAMASYAFLGRECVVTPVKLLVAVLILAFAAMETLPSLRRLSFGRGLIPVGGALSGFFGGLSGHQGALRSAFLIRAGLDKEAFIGTAAVSSVVVDVSRLAVYGLTFFTKNLERAAGGGIGALVAAGILASFAGSFVGMRLMKKVTMKALRVLVAVLLVLMGLALGFGLV